MFCSVLLILLSPACSALSYIFCTVLHTLQYPASSLSCIVGALLFILHRSAYFSAVSALQLHILHLPGSSVLVCIFCIVLHILNYPTTYSVLACIFCTVLHIVHFPAYSVLPCIFCTAMHIIHCPAYSALSCILCTGLHSLHYPAYSALSAYSVLPYIHIKHCSAVLLCPLKGTPLTKEFLSVLCINASPATFQTLVDVHAFGLYSKMICRFPKCTPPVFELTLLQKTLPQPDIKAFFVIASWFQTPVETITEHFQASCKKETVFQF